MSQEQRNRGTSRQTSSCGQRSHRSQRRTGHKGIRDAPNIAKDCAEGSPFVPTRCWMLGRVNQVCAAMHGGGSPPLCQKLGQQNDAHAQHPQRRQHASTTAQQYSKPAPASQMPDASRKEHLPDPCPDENLLYFQAPATGSEPPWSNLSTGRRWRTAAHGAWRSVRSSIPQSPKSLRDCLSVPGRMRSRPRLPNRVPADSARARPAVLAVLQAAVCRLQARTTHLDGVHYSQCLWRRRLARLLAARAFAPGAGRSSDHCAPSDWPRM